MKGLHIHIKGRVQGIGFRPFVYQLAMQHGLTGDVSNSVDGVHVNVQGPNESLQTFIKDIEAKVPSGGLVTSLDIVEVEKRNNSGFKIVESNEQGRPDLLITPDFALCESCRKELHDPENRRFSYPFITCTECGPRYSIESALPYDRRNTSMQPFEMCEPCREEYAETTNRRFYSQTNTCPDCKVHQWLADAQGNILSENDSEIVDMVSEAILAGKTVAVKGIGGFLLVCDAENIQAVQALREKKERPAKPFALLYPSINQVATEYYLSESERKDLTDSTAPIVLLRAKSNTRAQSFIDACAPGLDRLGVMLPYAPLLELIATKTDRPLLATSGNVKGSPIIFTNDNAKSTLSNFADLLLFNDRDIQVPQDDSVVKYAKKHDRRIFIRRSRGFAPGHVQSAVTTKFKHRVLALGALLKSSFCVWDGERCHVSQYLGDTTEFDAQISYEKTLDHIRKLLHFRPQVILVDKHPAYFTTLLGKELSARIQIQVNEIQHHKAHFWAVLGEHDLLENHEPILGVIFDGTGMGSDGAVWGGEFMRYHQGKIKRTHHVSYFPHILGDKMSLEPRLSSLSLMYASGIDADPDPNIFSAEEFEFFEKVLASSSLKTSSVGRIFDAVSSWLGYCHFNTYEGEAAMYLERAAQDYFDHQGLKVEPYPFTVDTHGQVQLFEMITAIKKNIDAGEEHGAIALRFHLTLVSVIQNVAEKGSYSIIAFSGGVFQNSLLVDLIIDQLEGKFDLRFQHDLAPNDECISYGQLVGYYAKKQLVDSNHDVEKTKIYQ